MIARLTAFMGSVYGMANCGASEITRRGFGPAAPTGGAPIASKSVGGGYDHRACAEPITARIVAIRKLLVACSRKLPKDESHPVRAISSHKSNAAPLDLQSWILVDPLVSHVSECSTIRTAFSLPRRDDSDPKSLSIRVLGPCIISSP